MGSRSRIAYRDSSYQSLDMSGSRSVLLVSIAVSTLITITTTGLLYLSYAILGHPTMQLPDYVDTAAVPRTPCCIVDSQILWMTLPGWGSPGPIPVVYNGDWSRDVGLGDRSGTGFLAKSLDT